MQILEQYSGRLAEAEAYFSKILPDDDGTRLLDSLAITRDTEARALPAFLALLGRRALGSLDPEEYPEERKLLERVTALWESPEAALPSSISKKWCSDLEQAHREAYAVWAGPTSPDNRLRNIRNIAAALTYPGSVFAPLDFVASAIEGVASLPIFRDEARRTAYMYRADVQSNAMFLDECRRLMDELVGILLALGAKRI